MQALGFTYGRAMRDGNHASVARFTCRCGSTHDQVIRPGQSVNPEEIAKRARRDGWDARSHKASATVCPTCLTARRAKRKMPPAAAPLALDPPGSPAAEAIAAAIQAHPTIQDMEVTLPMSRPTPAKPEPAPAATLPREATIAERVKIRSLLDANFDDAAGRYLDGYSDRRIGEEVGVPWAIVQRIREVGYGAIKVDPEIESIRAECVVAQERMNGARAEFVKEWEACRALLMGLADRVEKLAGKRAA